MSKKNRNSYSLTMIEAGLDPKKEIAFIVVADLFLLGVAVYAYMATKILIASLSILLLIVAGDYYLLGKAGRIKKVKTEKLEIEFVHIFSYFKIFINNGRPVYNALEDTIKYSSPDMALLLEELLKGIDEDKSVKPYLVFASKFNNLEIRQVMISIFKMSSEGGSSEYIRQFESVFASLSAEKRKFEVEKLSNNLDTMNFLPLADSALTIGLIVVAIVVIMGNLTYGL